MKVRLLLGPAVAALFGLATAPAEAQTIPFAQYAASGASANLAWIDTGSSGTLSALGTGADVEFEYTYPSLMAVGFLPADLLLTATSSSSAISLTNGGFTVLDQPGLAGTFAFDYTGAGFTANGRHFGHGTDLLSGTFSGGQILTFGSAGSVQDAISAGATVTYDSDVITFAGMGDKAFTLGFTSPTAIALGGSQLAGFTANSVGTYSAGAGSIGLASPTPEPATWAMFVLGLAGLGGVLRSRKRALPTATGA
jgi:hypothetical protein